MLSRLVGAVVVIGALALMAGLTFSFLGQSGPEPEASPTPTAAAAVSPSPSPTSAPTPGPTLPPTPTPTLTLPPTSEPSPTPLEIEVREGPGAITFGTENDRDLRITDPSVTFPSRGRMAWSAELTEPAGVELLQIDIGRVDADDGSEEIISTLEQEVDNPNHIRFLRRWRIQRLVDSPGIYVVRYLRDGQLMSEGYFRVEE
ncbi:hypothetical protein BH23CHL7_BH23CHL7_24420 [soil metagenome]